MNQTGRRPLTALRAVSEGRILIDLELCEPCQLQHRSQSHQPAFSRRKTVARVASNSAPYRSTTCGATFHVKTEALSQQLDYFRPLPRISSHITSQRQVVAAKLSSQCSRTNAAHESIPSDDVSAKLNTRSPAD